MCTKMYTTSNQYATLEQRRQPRTSCSSDDNIAKVHHNSLKVREFHCSRWQYYFLLAGCFLMWNGCFGRVDTAPQSCVLCDKNDIEGKDPRTNYEEFLFEHQVTRQDAIEALKAMNESSYAGTSSENSCKSITCSKKVMKYCLGPQFINDHCWCELGHNDEGLPFVPHICYVGEKVHTASVGSCFFYEEVKDCCCAKALAKQWRHISGCKSMHNWGGFLFSTAAILFYLLVIY